MCVYATASCMQGLTIALLPSEARHSPGAHMTRFTHAAWWAADYLYAAGKQIRALLGRRDPREFRGGAGRPVLILPGVYEPWGFLLPTITELHRCGHPIHVIDPLRNNRVSVPEGARLVAEYLAAHELDDVVIVAHSKGGLIGKHVMTFSREAERVRAMLAIATPFAGSRYATYLPGQTLRAFSPRDATIARLSQAPQANARIVSLFPRFDPHIPEGSALHGAENICVETGGHFRILAHPHTLAAARRIASAP